LRKILFFFVETGEKLKGIIGIYFLRNFSENLVEISGEEEFTNGVLRRYPFTKCEFFCRKGTCLVIVER
jgi:hypothetical protein